VRNRSSQQEDEVVKKLTAAFAAVAVLALGAGQAFAHPTHVSAGTKVTVVMKDPGCHWFSYGGKMTTKLAVHGPVRLANFDEAALKIVGPGTVHLAAVGKTVVLEKGAYKITMVGQAPDDNHLKLVVR
jgi:hypothetical protein